MSLLSAARCVLTVFFTVVWVEEGAASTIRHAAIGQQERDGVLPLDRPRSSGGTEAGIKGGHLTLLGWGAASEATWSRR